MKALRSVVAVLAAYVAITLVNEEILIKSLFLRQIEPQYIREHFWIKLSVHHLGQMALALLAMTLLLRRPLRSFGLNRASWPRSRRYMVWFGSVWSVLTALNFLPNLLQGRPEPLGFTPRVSDIAGWLAFKGLLSGTSEEIFFRGLLQTMLVAGWPGIPRLVRGKISLAAIIVAVIFAFAHIEFYFSPFTIEYSLVNVVAALVLGVFYGVAYDRTGSLLAPIVAHNYANLAMSLGAWGTVLLFG